MSGFKAENLAEVSRAISLEPLGPHDSRYASLSAARDTRELKNLRAYLENCAQEGCRASAAFIGHRGSGKTTELKRLEGELAPTFTTLHLEIDNSLQPDCDYTDLLLWLSDSLARFFQEQNMELDGSKTKSVADWFADRTIETSEELKKEVELETSAEVTAQAGTNLWFYAYSLKLYARLKARMAGNHEHRTLARQKLQNYSDDLLKYVNELLLHARQTLSKNNRPDRLLIVQDNLDRLQPEAALRLFRDNGDFLTRLDADCLWTAPINARLSPFRIDSLFDEVFTMPTIKVHDRDNKPVRAGIEGLVELVSKRIEIDLVFESSEVVEFLTQQSGGSVRDLLRLVGKARIAAQVDELTAIDRDSAEEAVKKLRLDFQGLFVPGDVYYPLLASIFRSKQDAGLAKSTSPEQAANNQHFFAALLVNGSVLEYNGDERWCDVHPAIHQIRAFQNALQATP